MPTVAPAGTVTVMLRVAVSWSSTKGTLTAAPGAVPRWSPIGNRDRLTTVAWSSLPVRVSVAV